MKKSVVAVWLMLLGAGGLYAAGTAAGTQVTNEVTLSYTVGGISQTDIVGNDDDGFLVDNKVDFTVANNDGDQIAVTPGSTDQVTNWTLENTGNDAQYFTLAASNLTGGETVYSDADTADTSTPYTITYSTDGGSTYGAYSGAFELAVGASVLIKVAADIPGSITDGDVMNIQLEATATDSGGTAITATIGADNEDSVDIVLAEGAEVSAEGNTEFDGQFSAWGGYIAQSAALAATKGSCVIWDPVKESSNPKRIPGAVVRYAIQVANTGSQDATDVNVTDVLNANLTYGTTTPAPTAVARIVTESCDCTNPGATNGDSISESSGTVTAAFATVTASTTECAYFDVTIN